MATVTKACCSPAPPAKDVSQGKEETLAGVTVYISGPPLASAAVILVPDLFGYEPPLTRKLADKLGAVGYMVVIPDYFEADGFTMPADGDFMKAFQPWIAKHHPLGEVEKTQKIVEAIKEKGIQSVGILGCCWGAKVAVVIAKQQDVKAVVQCHPSFVEESDYEEVAVPIAVLAAPTDGIAEKEGILTSRKEKLDSFVKIFPDVQHGWTLRYEEIDEKAVGRANEAHNHIIQWFAKYL